MANRFGTGGFSGPSGFQQSGFGMPWGQSGLGQPGFGGTWGQPGFGQSGFGGPWAQSSFGQPGFGGPWSQSGYGQPGFGGQWGFQQPGFSPGWPQPGYGQPGFGSPWGFGQPGGGMPLYGTRWGQTNFISPFYGGPAWGQTDYDAGYGLGGLRRWGGEYSAQFTTTGLPTDEEIEEMVYDAIDDDPIIPWEADIEVKSEAGVVTLTGTVSDKRIKHAAGQDAWWITGVTDVNNNIQVSGRHRVRGRPEERQGAQGARGAR